VEQDNHRGAKELQALVSQAIRAGLTQPTALIASPTRGHPGQKLPRLAVYPEAALESGVLVLRRKFPPVKCPMAVGCSLSVATNDRGRTNPR